MFDEADDFDFIPLSDVPAILPKHSGGRPVSVAAIFRWVQRGLRGHRLKAVQVGNRKCTTKTWLSEFFAALSKDAGLPGFDSDKPRTPKQRERAHNQALAELAAS